LDVIGFSRYGLIDYSKTLVDLASQRLTAVHPNVQFYTSQIDLEDCDTDLALSDENKSSLILLFGNTLGNVECWKKSLKRLFDGMMAGDRLFTSYAVFDPSIEHSEYVGGYLTDELRTAALEPLVMTGANPNSIDFSVSFDMEQLAVVGSAAFLDETVLSCSDEEIRLVPGSEVRCFLSRRFLPNEMEAEFARVGFDLLIHEQSTQQCIGYLMAKKA